MKNLLRMKSRFYISAILAAVLVTFGSTSSYAQFGIQDSVYALHEKAKDAGNTHNKGDFIYAIENDDDSVPSLKKTTVQPVVPHNIFIINSFSPDILWARNTADSLSSQLKKKSLEYRINTYFLNFDCASGYGYATKVLARIINDYGGKRPDVIVLIGDDAAMTCDLSGVLTGIWGGIPIVALGISQSVPAGIGKSAGIDYQRLPYRSRFFGVVAQTPVNENLKLINKIAPKVNRIVFIDNPYIESLYASELIKKTIKSGYPSIKYSSIMRNTSNADSVLNVIMKADAKTAFITYAWNYDGGGSSYTKHEIDSIFTTKLKAPLFSINTFNYFNNYIVGGYNPSESILAAKGTEIISNIFDQGKNYVSPSDLYVLKHGDYVINKMALKRFKLTSGIKSFYGVRYVNTVKGWLARHPGFFTLFILGMMLFFWLIFMYFHFLKQNVENRKNINQSKKVYEKYNSLFNESELNFAVYDGSGNKLFSIIKSKEQEIRNAIEKYLPENLYTSSIFTDNDVNDIRNKREVTREISTPKRISFMVSPVVGEMNTPYKYMMVISDITSEIQEVEQKEKLDSLINYAISTTDIGIACYNIISGEGYATEFWFSNLGENANGSGLIQPSYINLKEGDKAAITDFKQRLIKGKAGSFTNDIQLQNQPNGRNKWIRESIFLRETSAASGPVVVDINFNITADKVKEITEEKKVKEAHIAYQDSDRFINSISHEIRTPLTSIVGFSKMLLTEQNPKEVDNITGIIKRNNNVLIELFNNILSIAKIDSGLYKFSKDEVKLNGLFRELKTATVHMLQNEKQLTAKNIEIIAEIPLEDSTIVTDEWNFRQVMVNLLSNAVKFTKDGTITFGYQPQENGIYFYVKDTGCGISAKDQERIFNKFEKFDNYSMGTGLGLSLCKSIVRHLNGDLGVISNEGEGSTFWFVLKDLK